MPIGTFIPISCRPADDIHVGQRVVQGLLISPEDRAYLVSLEDSESIVSLTCPGRSTVHAPVRSLLRRMVPVPYSTDWYVSVTGTGPLYQSRR